MSRISSVASLGHDERRSHARSWATRLMLGLAFVGVTSPAHANIKINAIFDSTITGSAQASTIEASINQAIAVYEANISTNITVNINFASMTSGLGQSSTYYNTITYSQYLSALKGVSASAADTSALASLAANPVAANTPIDIVDANLRALGLNYNPPSGQPDCFIGLNTGICNLTRTSIDPSKYDLIAVAEHEIDEALGIGGSGSDVGGTSSSRAPLDLFRYSSAGNRSFTTSTSATAYFSIDNGATDIVNFNQSGGGSDYGDWASGGGSRVQNAYGTPGAVVNFGSAEQTALDVVGYNFVTAAAVPEPSSLILLAGGLSAGALSYVRRRAGR
jgi:hypothetical protein